MSSIKKEFVNTFNGIQESRKRGRPSKEVEKPKVAVAKKKTSGPPPPKGDIVGMALAAAISSNPVDPTACSVCKKSGFSSSSVLR